MVKSIVGRSIEYSVYQTFSIIQKVQTFLLEHRLLKHPLEFLIAASVVEANNVDSSKFTGVTAAVPAGVAGF